MRVKTGAVVVGRTIDLELESLDGENKFPNWDSLDTDKQFKLLSAYADYLLVDYMEENDMVTPEQASGRRTKLVRTMANCVK